MIILAKLILAHFIGDFLLQPKSWVKEKEIKKAASPKLYLHILIHGILILLLFWNLQLWPLALLLMLAHGIIDIIKLYTQKESNKSKYFLIDQGLHLLSILVIAYFWFQPQFDFIQRIAYENIWIYAVTLLFLTNVSGITIQTCMANWSKAINDNQDNSLNNAGKYIGMLERIFVFIFIITGNWSAIGFLLAAKSVFRFGDLKEAKDRKLTEYILIGTLLSFGLAIVTGLLFLRTI